MMYITFKPAFNTIIDLSFHSIPTINHIVLAVIKPIEYHGYRLNAAKKAENSKTTVPSHAIA